MDCRKCRTLISRELDGESTNTSREELKRHLESCDACREFRARVHSMMSIHRLMPETPCSPRLVASILAEAAGKRKASWMHGWLRFAVPAAAAAVFVLGFWIGSLMHDQYESAGVAAVASATEGLELEYLDECPPGSFGYLLTASYEGEGYETGRP
jgi:predicted anti-sigma-YlaC factor YlaD